MSLMGKAMETVSKLMPDRPEDTLISSHSAIGKPIRGIDGPIKVTGGASFAAEHPLPGLVYASLACSTAAKATILSIDTITAAQAPGVLLILTHENAPKLKKPPEFSQSGGADASGTTAEVLNTTHISWNGQPIAVVVAETQDQAEYTASLITATYETVAADLSFDAKRGVAEAPKIIMGEDASVSHGDAEAALASAPFAVDETYTTPMHSQNAIEPHATTAQWVDEKLRVYDATQFLHGTASSLAKMLSMDKKDVEVLAPFVGGGFGGKVAMWPHVQLCAVASKCVSRPVRLVLTREQVFQTVGGRTPSEQRLALGADADGKLTSLIHTGVTAMSFDNTFPEQFTFPSRHLYSMPTYLIGQKALRLNMPANTFMRAPGDSIGTFALESAMDELAWKLQMDPIELRRRNEPERDPTKDTEFSSRHLLEAFELGASKFGWNQQRTPPRSQQEGEWLIGYGMASAYYPAIRLPTAARVRISKDGTALIQTSAQEIGVGTATAQTQHASDLFGLPMEKIYFEYGDTAFPAANQAGGSSQTISIALAVQTAFTKLTERLLKLAHSIDKSPLQHTKLESARATQEGLFDASSHEGMTYAAMLTAAGKEFVEAEADAAMPFEMMKYSMQSFGAHFCEIRVNAITGETRVHRWVAAFDTGRIVNPKTSTSQFRGGIIMGLGAALMEESHFDERSGRIANTSLAEYHVPVNADVPNIETYFLDIPDPHTPMGAHGVGEIGITGVAAAVANAIFHATGKRVRDLPITLDKVL